MTLWLLWIHMVNPWSVCSSIFTDLLKSTCVELCIPIFPDFCHWLRTHFSSAWQWNREYIEDTSARYPLKNFPGSLFLEWCFRGQGWSKVVCEELGGIETAAVWGKSGSRNSVGSADTEQCSPEPGKVFSSLANLFQASFTLELPAYFKEITLQCNSDAPDTSFQLSCWLQLWQGLSGQGFSELSPAALKGRNKREENT